MTDPEKKIATASWLVCAGRPSESGDPLNVPLVPASNFLLGAGSAYARDDGTPTWEALEAIVGGLEEGRAVSFASGMAAIAAVFDQLATGSLVVIPTDCYQGVTGLALDGEQKGRFTVERLPVDDAAAWIDAAARADLLWLESPSNPLLLVADLPAICGAWRKSGALVAVDNTLATPLVQRPLDLGADLSVQSATKLIGGHSDLLAGVVTTRNPALYDALRKARELSGATPGVLEAYLAVRGARTLALRFERSQATATMMATRLRMHPRVLRVRYPGFGTVISFDLYDDAGAANAVCACVRLIRHATSLGGVESTMERRAAVPGQGHLPPSLLRLSVGIEDPEDLWSDLEDALDSYR